MKFNSIEQAESFKKANRVFLDNLENECSKLPGVLYAEVWLCGKTESFVACFNENDEIIKEVLIVMPETIKARTYTNSLLSVSIPGIKSACESMGIYYQLLANDLGVSVNQAQNVQVCHTHDKLTVKRV